MSQYPPFTYIPPTYASPIPCPYCSGSAPLVRREPPPEVGGEIRVFDCRDCGKASAMTVPR